MPLPRFQLFEFNDLAATPAPLRDQLIESLSRMLRWGGMLRSLVAPMRAFIDATRTREVLDLCAGAGGPAAILVDEMRAQGVEPPRFWLTDLFPRVEAWTAARAARPGHVDFVPEPVDATAIPEPLARGRARMVINALHHFPPEIARAVFADAVAAHSPVFVSESFDRNPLRFAAMGPVGIVAALANPVLSERDRLAKALLTWASPVALAVSAWDGFVSTLRVYTEDELRAFVAPFGGGYEWVYGTYPFAPWGKGYYFYGVPGGRGPAA